MNRILILLPVLLVLSAGAARAKNVDVVTLPRRDTVQLTIYNSEDLTLVRETRHLTLKRGRNRIQFSWANTLIDPSSVEFRPLEHRDRIELADTEFPGEKPQHLVWNVDSRIEGEVAVEVSYFTSGLTWSMDYTAITDPAEERMDFTGYVRVFNRSGEAYDNARIRLIVGTINLVEKIADLARVRGLPVPGEGTARRVELRREAAKSAFDAAERAARAPAAGAKKIVKEGLSEYFMFSIEGTETVDNGWSKRMRAVRSKETKFAILYRLREHQYGPRPVRFFVWRNAAEHGLGGSPLPDGRVRIFRENGADGLAYLGEQLVRYVPIGAPIEVNLGPDDLVVYERIKLSTRRFEFHFHRSGNRETVDGWNETVQWVDTIRNDRGKPIRFELRRVWNGDVEYASEMEAKLFDYHTVEAAFELGARSRLQYPHTATTRFGKNARQSRVALQ